MMGASPWRESLVAVGVASAIPLVATWWLASRPALTATLVPRLILLAAGALLGAALFHLIPEALSDNSRERVLILVGLGVLALAALERVIHGMERPHEGEQGDNHAALGERAHLMPLGIVSDALHNAIDGALVATAFLTDPSLGVFAGVAIALHELPRELGTFALCVSGGMSARKAILVNAATGVLALLGAVGALLVGVDAERFGRLLLPFAAGNFLYLATAILVALRAPRPAPRRVVATAASPSTVALHAGGHSHDPAGETQTAGRDSPMMQGLLVATGVAMTALLAGVHS